MAEQNVLNISLKEYKKSIDDLRASLLNLEKGSEEYNATVEEIAERQNRLNEVMNAGKTTYDSTTNSLNGMKEKLKELKSEFGNMEVGTEQWHKAQEEIGELNGKIGEVEQGMGIFSRNVGNYSSAFNNAINSMGGSVGNLIPVIGGLKNGFIALQKVPIVALIAAIAMALQQLIKAFKSSQENVDGLNKAMAPMKAVMDKITRVFEQVAGAIIKVIEPIMRIIGKFGELAAQSPILQAQLKLLIGIFEALGWVLDKVADAVDWVVDKFNALVDVFADAGVGLAQDMQAARKEMEELARLEAQIAEDQANYNKMEREHLIEKAKLENDVAALQAQIADKDNLTTKQRRQALNDLKKRQNQIIDIEEQELRLKLRILQAQNQLSGSTAEQLKAEKEIEAALIRIAGKREEINRGYNQTSARLTKEEKSANETALREKKEAEKKKQEAAKKSMQAEIDYIETQLKYTEKGTGKEYALRKELADKRLELATYTAKHEEMTAEALNKKLLSLHREYLAELKNIYTERLDFLEKHNEKLYEYNRLSAKEDDTYYRHRQALDKAFYVDQMERAVENLENNRRSSRLLAMLNNDTYAEMLKGSADFYTKMQKFTPFKNWLAEEGTTLNEIYKDLDTFRTYLTSFFGQGMVFVEPEQMADAMREVGFQIDQVANTVDRVSLTFQNAEGEMEDFTGSSLLLKQKMQELGLTTELTYKEIEGSMVPFTQALNENGDVVYEWEEAITDAFKDYGSLFDGTFEQMKQSLDSFTSVQKQDFMQLMTNIYDAESTFMKGMNEITDEMNKAPITDLVKTQQNELLQLVLDGRDRMAEIEYDSQNRMLKDGEEYNQRRLEQIEELIGAWQDMIRANTPMYENDLEVQERVGNLMLQRNQIESTLAEQRASRLQWENEMLNQYGEHWKEIIESGVQAQIEGGEMVNAKVDENLEVRAGLFSSAFGSIHSITEEYLDRENALYELQHLTWDKNAETYEQFLQRKEQATQKYVKAAQKLYQRDAKNLVAFTSSVGSLLGAVGDAWEDEIERKKEAGEEDSKELEKEWKRMQALQIAAAIVSTISGAVAAYMNDVKTYQPAWVGMAIGAVDAAATLVAGYAQVQTIRNQKFDPNNPDSTGGGSPQQTVTVAGATPLLDEATDLNSLQDLPMANGSGEQGDSRVYILQTDISESDRQVEVRQNSTTF
jgi:DNA repair exonuclease SbcCD ATPase subunit